MQPKGLRGPVVRPSRLPGKEARMKRAVFSHLIVGLCGLWVGPVAGQPPPPESPAPAASAAVQRFLDEAAQWTKDKQRPKALEAADRSLLMTALHRHLRQGMAKDEALRRAMAEVRKYPAMAHPYFWAAFILTGDPDNPALGVRQ